jgi:hypothetical protein
MGSKKYPSIVIERTPQPMAPPLIYGEVGRGKNLMQLQIKLV